ILSRFLVIFAQILRLRHPHQESGFFRALRLGHASIFSSEQSRMARKQVLKAETCHEVAPLGGNSPIVIRAVTKKVETLGLLLPAPRFHIAYPEIPSSGHFITYVVEMMLLNKFQNLRWRQNLAPQIEFLDGRFGCIHGAHSHLSKTQRPAGQWNGRKKMLEMSK